MFRSRWLVAPLWALPTLIVGGIWIYSGFTPRSTVLQFPQPAREVRLTRNYVHLETADPPVPASSITMPPNFGKHGPPYNLAFSSSRGYFMGWVSVGKTTYVRGTQASVSHSVAMSLVIPFLLTIPTALMAARTWQRGSLAAVRRRAGLCPKCGYDLRATPDRCPECGLKVSSA